MSTQRIKGQEVTILVVRDGNLEDTLTDILNFNAEIQSEVKTQGYLGERGNRTDDIFNQVKFDFEAHTHTRAWLDFLRAINDRQQRITPDVVINLSATLLYPNGDTPIIVIPDAKFESVPINIGGRGEYVKKKFSGMADTYTVQDG